MVTQLPQDLFSTNRIEWRSFILRIDLMEKAFEATVLVTVHNKTRRKIMSRDLKK